MVQNVFSVLRNSFLFFLFLFLEGKGMNFQIHYEGDKRYLLVTRWKNMD